VSCRSACECVSCFLYHPAISCFIVYKSARDSSCIPLGHELTGRFLLNDTYRTDVHLLYPPHIVALAALYIGFTLSSMTPATRSRSHSTQTNFPLSAAEINAALTVPAPPTIPAEFMASFQVNLPILLACVQEIIILYPVWEKFEPVPIKGKQPVDTTGEGSKVDSNGQAKFGPEDAERLVRMMINERMEDVMAADGNQLAGKKRQRSAGGP